MSKHYTNTYNKLPILDGLELLHAKNHSIDFPFHTHNTFNIALILNQTFYTKLSDKFLQAPVGTLSITNPDEVHATPCDTNIGNSFFTFYISPDVFKELNNNADIFFEDKVIYDEELFSSLYFLSQNLNSASINVEYLLLADIKKLITNYASPNKFKYKERKLFSSFINETSFEKFSLEKTATKFGLNKFKFLRLFKQETGLTPNNFILLQRIEKCKKLLQTDADLLSIAINSGFYDATHLCKNFKRFTGVTPLEYRNY